MTDANPPTPAKTVLVVEDEPAVRQFATLVLKMQGYTVLEAGLGGDAIRLAETYPGPIHLLLTDVLLPDTRGRDVADRLTGTVPDLRVLYMSGYTADELSDTEIRDAGLAFLKKPFAMTELVRRVAELLDRIDG